MVPQYHKYRGTTVRYLPTNSDFSEKFCAKNQFIHPVNKMEVFMLHVDHISVQLVTVQWGYCPPEAWLMLLPCAVLCHYESDSSLSLTLLTGPTNIGSQLICCYWIPLVLYAIYGTKCVGDLWQRTSWGHWCKRTYIVGWTTATLFYSRNSWHCDKTYTVSSEYRGSFSIRNNFPGPLSLFYAASSGFWCGKESFPRAQSCLYLY